MSAVLQVLRIATHYEHLLHPLTEERGTSETELWKRATCVALFIIPSSMSKKCAGIAGSVAVLYLISAIWKYRKVLEALRSATETHNHQVPPAAGMTPASSRSEGLLHLQSNLVAYHRSLSNLHLSMSGGVNSNTMVSSDLPSIPPFPEELQTANPAPLSDLSAFHSALSACHESLKNVQGCSASGVIASDLPSAPPQGVPQQATSASLSFSPQPPKKDYSTLRLPKPEEHEALRELLEYLANARVPSDINYCNERTKRFSNLNPLQQIEHILNNQELNGLLNGMRSRRMPLLWSKYVAGMGDARKKMSDSDLKSYLPGFYKAIRIDRAIAEKYAVKGDWANLVRGTDGEKKRINFLFVKKSL